MPAVNLAREAEQYAQRGLCVFPVKEKRPCRKGSWKEYSTNDTAAAKKLFLDTPHADGIAIDCGKSGLVVVDVDIKGVNGFESLDRLAAEGLSIDKNTWAQRTGSGGAQFFYRASGDDITVSVGSSLGIDFRGAGGYVVIPPSLHPNGKRYEWYEGQAPGSDAELLPVDGSVRALWHRTEGASSAPGSKTSPSGTSKTHVQRIGDGETYHEGQGRNNALYLWCSYRRGQGWNEGEIQAEAEHINATQFIPPLSKKELDKVISQGSKHLSEEEKMVHALDFDPPENDIICFADIEAKNPEWLWEGIIPRGMITTVQGDPGSGKTYFTAGLAAALSVGQSLPDVMGEQHQQETQNTGLINGEDDASYTIKRRLDALGADSRRIFMLDESKQPLDFQQLKRIENLLKTKDIKLLIFDPLQQFLGRSVDMHRANDVRPVLAALGRLAAKYNTAVLLVMHMNKYGGGKAMYRGLGSIDFAAIARSQLLIGPNRNDPETRLVVQTKNSLDRLAVAQKFSISSDMSIQWLGPDITAGEQDILQEAKAPKEDSALQEAIVFVRDQITKAPIFSSDLEDLAIEKGISLASLRRARKELSDKGEAISDKAPGLRRWYIAKRNAKVSFNDGIYYPDDLFSSKHEQVEQVTIEPTAPELFTCSTDSSVEQSNLNNQQTKRTKKGKNTNKSKNGQDDQDAQHDQQVQDDQGAQK